MAYKFQFGTTKLSGSTTFEEALVGESTISGSGRLSGKELILDAVGVIGTSGDADLLTLSTDKLSVAGDISASIDLQGSSVVIQQNGTVGVAGDIDLLTLAPNSVSVAGALSASGQVNLPGAVRFGTENQTTVSAVGVLSSSAAATIHSVDADELTTEKLTVTSTFSAATLSASLGITGSSLEIYSEGGGTPFIRALNGQLSASGVASLYDVRADSAILQTADINGGTLDDVIIGGSNTASAKFTTVSASSTADFAGQARFGVDNQLTISAVGLLSGSATATLHNATLDRITVGDADINGGNIDGTVIGATTEAAVSATTLSASSTLNVVGASNFGPGNLASISAAGVISGSGDSTLHRLDSNQLVYGSASLNGPQYLNKLALAGAGAVTEIMGLSSGSLLYHDEATGLMKLGSFSSYALALAGTGITATDGVLSVDTTGGDSVSATHIPAAAGGNAALSVGLNFMTTDVTGSSLLVLPSASAGDVVIVKAPAGVSSTNFIKITSSVAAGDEIDGFSEARIESPFGAVSLIYSNSDGKWVIY